MYSTMWDDARLTNLLYARPFVTRLPESRYATKKRCSKSILHLPHLCNGPLFIQDHCIGTKTTLNVFYVSHQQKMTSFILAAKWVGK